MPYPEGMDSEAYAEFCKNSFTRPNTKKELEPMPYCPNKGDPKTNPFHNESVKKLYGKSEVVSALWQSFEEWCIAQRIEVFLTPDKQRLFNEADINKFLNKDK